MRDVVRVLGRRTATAHHSHGNYTDTFIDLQGTVKEVHLLNPHSWVYMDVRNAGGQPQTWAIEATNKIGLERIGVTADTIKPATRSRSLSSAARRLARLPAGIPENEGWRGRRTGTVTGYRSPQTSRRSTRPT